VRVHVVADRDIDNILLAAPKEVGRVGEKSIRLRIDAPSPP
jgi:hypothetical protein